MRNDRICGCCGVAMNVLRFSQTLGKAMERLSDISGPMMRGCHPAEAWDLKLWEKGCFGPKEKGKAPQIHD